jgi:DNA-directed RNA polymerase subunit RPC12/RpoP
MFLLVGTRAVRRNLRGSVPVRAHCAQCGLVSEMHPQTLREFFTLFLVPIIPISKARQIITCGRCGASYSPDYRGFTPGTSEDPDPTKTVLLCPSCSGKLRVPLRPDNAIRVTCPHCGDKFTVSINKS